MPGAGIPPALKRHNKWFWLVLGLNFLGTPLLAASTGRLDWTLKIILATALALLGSIAAVGILIYLNKRDVAVVRRLRGHVCTECLYDLSTSPERGNCPECGITYTKADIVRQWRDTENSYQAKKFYSLDEDSSDD